MSDGTYVFAAFTAATAFALVFGRGLWILIRWWGTTTLPLDDGELVRWNPRRGLMLIGVAAVGEVAVLLFGHARNGYF